MIATTASWSYGQAVLIVLIATSCCLLIATSNC
jgi:hypothetical protein